MLRAASHHLPATKGLDRGRGVSGGEVFMNRDSTPHSIPHSCGKEKVYLPSVMLREEDPKEIADSATNSSPPDNLGLVITSESCRAARFAKVPKFLWFKDGLRGEMEGLERACLPAVSSVATWQG